LKGFYRKHGHKVTLYLTLLINVDVDAVVRLIKTQVGTPESGAWWEHASCPFEREATEAEALFHNSILRNFMVYRDRLETNLL